MIGFISGYRFLIPDKGYRVVNVFFCNLKLPECFAREGYVKEFWEL